MISLKRKLNCVLGLSVILFSVFSACDPKIEDSPQPGILRVTLESDPTDTTIIIVTDTLTVSDGDVFLISIFQGRSYQDSTWGILYPSIESY